MKIASLTTLACTALLACGFGLTGCSDDEIAAGAAGAAGGIIIGSALDHHHDHYHGGGYYGGGYHGGYGGGYHGGYHGGYRSFANTEAVAANGLTTGASTDAVAPAPSQNQDARVRRVADNYQVSDYAATYVVRAFMLAQQKDMSGISDMGLTTSDFSDLSQGKDLAPEKISAMSQKLMLTPAATKNLASDLQSDIQEELNAQN